MPGLYKGVLGTYALDQVLASSPIGKPTVAGGVLPLTGLPGSVPNRPAVVVKVDNSSKARPAIGPEQRGHRDRGAGGVRHHPLGSGVPHQ